MTDLPTSLVRYRGELETAIGRELLSRRRGRRPVLRIAVVTGAAAAVAVGAFTTLPGNPGGSLVEPASAAQRAAAALAAPQGSIVHVDMVVDQRNADGSHTSWRVESWQETEPPYELRERVTGTGSAGATPQPATAQPFRQQVLDLLRSGKLTRSGSATVDGRPTVSFAWSDGHTRYEYTVDARTYDPVRWRFAPDDASSETTITFETYEILPDTARVNTE
jgi:hypothetical protein